MAALSASRIKQFEKMSSVSLAGKTEQVYQGGIACFDTSTGLVAKAFASTTLHPIGTYADDQNTASGGNVLVKLFNEVTIHWFTNDTTHPVVAADIGGLCYLLDDQTVADTDLTNTLSVAGRVWKIDSVKGVGVEMRMGAGVELTGLDG